jgi:hypothetical protein
MIPGRPRESLVLFDDPEEMPAGADLNDPFKKSYGTMKRGTLPPLENKPFH